MQITREQLAEIIGQAVGAGTGAVMSEPEGQSIVMPEAKASAAVDALLAEFWRDDEDGPDPLDRAIELVRFSDEALAAVMEHDHRRALGSDVALVLALQAIACALISHADAHQVRRPVQTNAG